MYGAPPSMAALFNSKECQFYFLKKRAAEDGGAPGML
jgi:hypothetical protein